MSAHRSRSVAGFTLIESLIAMILISAILALLAPSLFHVANERVSVDAALLRQSVLRGEFNRLASLTFADLDGEAGCTTVSDTDLPHTRCITVTTLSERERSLKVQVTPSSSFIPSDSVVMMRTDREANPFNTAEP
jgi:prepilin-type N-terminal cleavage/methylation domain-containing protein